MVNTPHLDKPVYMIVRHYFDEEKPQKIMQRRLTLEEAQEWCSRESTHKKDKDGNVVWFDGYTEM